MIQMILIFVNIKFICPYRTLRVAISFFYSETILLPIYIQVYYISLNRKKKYETKKL